MSPKILGDFDGCPVYQMIASLGDMEAVLDDFENGIGRVNSEATRERSELWGQGPWLEVLDSLDTMCSQVADDEGLTEYQAMLAQMGGLSEKLVTILEEHNRASAGEQPGGSRHGVLGEHSADVLAELLISLEEVVGEAPGKQSRAMMARKSRLRVEKKSRLRVEKKSRLRVEKKSRLRVEKKSRLRVEKKSRLRMDKKSRLRKEKKSRLRNEKKSRLRKEKKR